MIISFTMYRTVFEKNFPDAFTMANPAPKLYIDDVLYQLMACEDDGVSDFVRLEARQYEEPRWPS